MVKCPIAHLKGPTVNYARKIYQFFLQGYPWGINSRKFKELKKIHWIPVQIEREVCLKHYKTTKMKYQHSYKWAKCSGKSTGFDIFCKKRGSYNTSVAKTLKFTYSNIAGPFHKVVNQPIDFKNQSQHLPIHTSH